MKTKRAGVCAAIVGLAAGVVVVGSGAAAPMPSGTLAFATGSDGKSDRLEIAVARPDASWFSKVTHNTIAGRNPVFTSDGRHILFDTIDSFTEEGALWQMKRDGTGIRRVPDLGYPSPSGRKFAQPTKRGVELYRRDGRLLRRLPLRLGRSDSWDDLQWSPDERHLAAGIGTETARADYARVFILRVDGRRPARVLSKRVSGRDDFVSAWSRDGSRLLVERDTDRRTRPYVVKRAYVVAVSSRRRYSVRSDFVHASTFAVAPDFSRVAYITKRGALVTAPLVAGPPRKLTRVHRDDHGRIGVAWSPQHNWLAYSDSDGVHVLRPDGSGRRRITRLTVESDLNWAPDGDRLAFSVAHGQAIYMARTSGRALKLLAQSIWDDSPQWSPDGSSIAFLHGPNGLDDPRRLAVVVTKRDGTGRRRLGRGYGPRWSPDGRLLAFVDAARSRDPASMGKLRAGDVVVTSAEGTGRHVVARGTDPAWSPAGTRVAFMRYVFERVESEAGGREWAAVGSAAFVVGADGTALRQIVATTRTVLYHPTWSPDGHTIAFGAWDEGAESQRHAAFVDVDSPGQLRFVDELAALEFAWSPDGERLAFASYDGVVSARVDGSDWRVLSRNLHVYSSPVWSPDGSAVAFIGWAHRRGSDDEIADVYVVAADGSAQTRVTNTPGVEGAVDWGA